MLKAYLKNTPGFLAKAKALSIQGEKRRGKKSAFIDIRR